MKEKYVLTIDKVKSTLAFESFPEIQRNFESLCDCWYQIALKSGKTEEEAALEAMDNLSNKLNEFGKSKSNN